MKNAYGAAMAAGMSALNHRAGSFHHTLARLEGKPVKSKTKSEAVKKRRKANKAAGKQRTGK